MKRLLLVRHAKSSWDFPQLSDFERPLNERGLRDVQTMGQRLKALGIRPEGIVSSGAKRALDTAEGMGKIWGESAKNIQMIPALYHADAEALCRIIKNLPAHLNQVMLVAHNPGITDLVNQLAVFSTDNIPTCGVVVIDFEVAQWQQVSAQKAQLHLYEYPKKNT
ncbi:histidine phosphatase family protein [Cytophagales bacterium LB-30]|uniref:Histidine phosphatase family protein n=1 Tax=Shiella aurantiaca TaxID=3058365 RepID=A0ABT8F708_9BACT|nr:histidine phosphatase family protein [Shiella aurantiaca]MDN4166272.1 histidine phosphatase family protein [Shiella aurantiaca]